MLFKRTDVPMMGLNSGDVVALKVRGSFLSAVPSHQEKNTLYVLIPSHDATIEDDSVLLEVVRHGEWIGFRSWVANNAMLQATKKGAHRLLFYSERFGIYEQWSCVDIHALDSIHWKSTVMTLQNRKVRGCEMRVEVYRVGCIKEGGHHVQHVPSRAPGVDDVESMKTISGMMVQEWIKFVEKEKQRRCLLQARVEQAIDNVDGLKHWASEQIQCARRDVQEEIELLIEALQGKNAELADVNARLTTRIQWGAALLEAKKATVLGRRVLLAWKSTSARSKYCDAVILKLRRRNQVKYALSALDSWMAVVQTNKDLQTRLRLGVGRMSSLKMRCAFARWREFSYKSHEQARINAKINYDACLISQSQLAKRVVHAWRRRAHRSTEAHRLLSFCEARHNESLLLKIFRAWKMHKATKDVSIQALHDRFALRERMNLLSTVLHSWMVFVDDGLGEKIEFGKSISVYRKKTKFKTFRTWQRMLQRGKDAVQMAESMKSSQEVSVKSQCLKLWKEHAVAATGRRANLVAFVISVSENNLRTSMRFWKEYASYKRQTKLHVSKAENRRRMLALSDCTSWWRALSQESKMHRKFVNLCSQRRDIKRLKTVFCNWRNQCQRSTRTYANLVNYSEAWSMKRMKTAFAVLHQHATESILEQGMYRKAANWCSQRLRAKVMYALQLSVQQHSLFLGCLERIQFEHNLSIKKSIWNAWAYETDETVGRNALCHNFRNRNQWHMKNQYFVAWRSFIVEDRFWDRSALARKNMIDLKRKRWLFHIWRQTSSSSIKDKGLHQKAACWYVRKKSMKVIQAWIQYQTNLLQVHLICEDKYLEKERSALFSAFISWKNIWLYNNHLLVSGQKVMDSYAARLQTSALVAWRNKTAVSRFEESQMKKALAKLLYVRLQCVFHHWHQMMEDGSGKTAYCLHLERIVVRRKTRRTLSEVFAAWRSRHLQVKFDLQHMEDRERCRLNIVKSSCFCTWRHTVATLAFRQMRAIEMFAKKQTLRISLESFLFWRQETVKQSRNGIVMIHCVERVSYRLMKQSWIVWRTFASREREQRSTMIQMLNNYFIRSMKKSFDSWRKHASEESRVRKNLERCILQKKVALNLFRQSYWETIDNQLHETLGAMFADDESQFESGKIHASIVSSDYMGTPSKDSAIGEDDYVSAFSSSLADISKSLESKQVQLSTKVSRVLEQCEISPGHALTPPKRELNMLEPLQYFFSRNDARESISGAESISLSNTSSPDPLDVNDRGTEILDIGDYSSPSCTSDDFSEYPRLDTTKKHCALQRQSALKGIQGANVYSPPGSPLILARDNGFMSL